MEHPLNFANTNSLWGGFLVETLFRLGVRNAVVSPGSRSAPLTCALAHHPGIQATPVLDERSAAFFALGIAKRSRRPVLVVCTSGTAGANFFPAVIEARESRVPLLVLTADRPPELRECSSGQTIDQVKLFGDYPRWQVELGLPEVSEKLLGYLRQTLRYACERSLWPVAGPVHLNQPFRDPLAPTPDGSLSEVDREKVAGLLEGIFPVEPSVMEPSPAEVERLGKLASRAKRPVIVAGAADTADPEGYAKAVIGLARRRNIPVLADVLSPVRHYGSGEACVFGEYDFLLEQGRAPVEAPDFVLRLGGLPTSKRLRRWLEALDCRQFLVDEGDRNLDSLHVRSVHLRCGVETLVEKLTPWLEEQDSGASRPWLESWLEPGTRVREAVSTCLMECEEMFEGKLPWVLAHHAPPGSVAFISNSTPVRDAEYFWDVGGKPVEVYFNRGANGIDGILSTAMGVASEAARTFLVIGDLAFLHDQNALLNAKALRRGGLTILLINNRGGGIFNALPIAEFEPPFEEFFVTPQDVDLGAICGAHGISHRVIACWENLIAAIEEPWDDGIRVLEIRTDAVKDQALRTRLLRGE